VKLVHDLTDRRYRFDEIVSSLVLLNLDAAASVRLPLFSPEPMPLPPRSYHHDPESRLVFPGSRGSFSITSPDFKP